MYVDSYLYQLFNTFCVVTWLPLDLFANIRYSREAIVCKDCFLCLSSDLAEKIVPECEMTRNHTRSQRCSWCTCTPGRIKKFRHNLQEKLVSSPQHTNCSLKRRKSQFLDMFCFGQGRFGSGSGSFSSFRPSFEGEDHRRSQDFVCGGALFYHPAKTPKN